MVEHGQATVEGIGIAVAIAALLAALALGMGPSADSLAAAAVGALGRTIPGPSHERLDDGLTDDEREIAQIVRQGDGADAPDLADLAALLDARLGPIVGRLVLARVVQQLVATEPARPCVIPGSYGSHETYRPAPGSSPSIHVTTPSEQDRWVRSALAGHPVAELIVSGLGVIPVLGSVVALADVARELPEDAPLDSIEPGHRAGDIVVEQAVAGDANGVRAPVRVRMFRSSGGGALRAIRDVLVQKVYPTIALPCR